MPVLYLFLDKIAKISTYCTNRHKVIKSENSPVFWPTLYLPYRVSGLNTYGRRAFWVAGPMAWNSLPAGIQPAAQTVLGVYLKRTCSRVTSASSTWGSQWLRAIQFHARTHSFTHGVVEWNRISSLQSHEKALEKEHCLPDVFRDTGDTPANFFCELNGHFMTSTSCLYGKRVEELRVGQCVIIF